MRIHLLMIAVAGLGIAADDKDDASKKDLTKMQGSWVAVSYTIDGKMEAPDALKKLKLSVKGNMSTIELHGQISKGTYKLDAGQKPKTLDIAVTDGPEKGKTKLAIYEFDGETFKVCLAPDGKERPKEFTSKAGSGTILEVWKKVPAPK